jgi:hypothetical protein
MSNPFWEFMVRTGMNAYCGVKEFAGAHGNIGDPPAWCFDRFGQSRTRLPDGRVVCVAGEHEDYYDPDFCIYNDVVLFAPDGVSFEIHGYPADVFPPTDFQTATLLGSDIFLLGSLGYQGQRGETIQSFRLNTATLRIERIATAGDRPPWLFKHIAEPDVNRGAIVIWGGETPQGRNLDVFELSLCDLQWSRIAGTPPLSNPLVEGYMPKGWELVVDHVERANLADSVRRAIAPGHPLWGYDFFPVAHGFGILSMIRDGSGRLANVNAGFVGREELGESDYAIFESLEDARAWMARASE